MRHLDDILDASEFVYDLFVRCVSTRTKIEDMKENREGVREERRRSEAEKAKRKMGRG